MIAAYLWHVLFHHVEGVIFPNCMFVHNPYYHQQYLFQVCQHSDIVKTVNKWMTSSCITARWWQATCQFLTFVVLSHLGICTNQDHTDDHTHHRCTWQFQDLIPIMLLILTVTYQWAIPMNTHSPSHNWWWANCWGPHLGSHCHLCNCYCYRPTGTINILLCSSSLDRTNTSISWYYNCLSLSINHITPVSHCQLTTLCYQYVTVLGSIRLETGVWCQSQRLFVTVYICWCPNLVYSNPKDSLTWCSFLPLFIWRTWVELGCLFCHSQHPSAILHTKNRTTLHFSPRMLTTTKHHCCFVYALQPNPHMSQPVIRKCKSSAISYH